MDARKATTAAIRLTTDWSRMPPGRVPGLLAIALALFIVAVVALSANLIRLRESFAWVEHTNLVLRNISAIERALLEAESGERGYLLTGEGSYLEGYNRARVEIPKLIEAMGQMVSDSPDQMQRLNELHANIDERLAEFRQAVEAGPARVNDALAILRTARSRQLTPQIEEKLRQLRGAELSLLQDRQQRADRLAVIGTFLAAATGALALLSAAIGAFLLQRQRSINQLRAANSELTRSRDSLRAREAHQDAVLATVPDAMIVVDGHGHIQSFSATAERLFGFAADEVRGQNVSVLMPEPYRREHDGYLARYIATGVPRIVGITRVTVGQRKDGKTFPIELSVGEILIEGTRQFVGFARDLTQRQERERLLHEVQSELIHVSRLSTMGEMASNLAHELNQPLSAMSNYLRGSKRLLEGCSDERSRSIREALDKAAEQALRAGQVIRRLRDFVARGETEKRIESITSLVEDACTLALLAAKEQPVQLILQFDPTADLVLVDKVQVQQILLNLLRNAIEAMQTSPRRELTVSTAPAADGMVAVTVADTGVGLSSDVASRLFQPFVTTKPRGIGIGLSISRTIVESHGGQITAMRNPKGGTILRFTLRGVSAGEVGDTRPPAAEGHR